MNDDANVFGYGNETNLHPLGLIAVLVLGVALVLLPRRYAILPMLVMACFISSAQRVIFASLNFDLMRIMVLFGTARLLLRNEISGLRWKNMDSVFVAWVIVGAVAYCLCHATPEAIKYRLGTSYDALGMYFLFRLLIRTPQDLWTTIKCFTLVSIPVAAAFMYEHTTRYNVFAIFGGVEEITWVREGKLRCQGAFAHPLIAGCFWAALLPLIGVAWFKKDGGIVAKIGAVAGVVAATVVIFNCSSSTPIMGILFAILGTLAFFVRYSLRAIRWTVLVALVGLHLTMNAPIWHLLVNVDLVGGSTGYYRYVLIDKFLENFHEWMLFGVKSTTHWDEIFDITNQFVLEGVNGGLLTLILFVALITLAFQGVGRMWRAAGKNTANVGLAWALGVTMFVHCGNFMGISYFSQCNMLWYLTLAAIASMAPGVVLAKTKTSLPGRMRVWRKSVTPVSVNVRRM